MDAGWKAVMWVGVAGVVASSMILGAAYFKSTNAQDIGDLPEATQFERHVAPVAPPTLTPREKVCNRLIGNIIAAYRTDGFSQSSESMKILDAAINTYQSVGGYKCGEQSVFKILEGVEDGKQQ